MNYYSKRINSPVGELTLIASDGGLAGVLWGNELDRHKRFSAAQYTDNHPLLQETERQLAAYFSGKLRSFNLPLDFNGTDFQKKVWRALLDIPFGETRSYADIARVTGNPKAVRAVGAANGKNPVSIIAPCHRVIGTNGQLTGFAGGLPTKAFLLALESQQAEQDRDDKRTVTGS